jgi:hypothetical protein
VGVFATWQGPNLSESVDGIGIISGIELPFRSFRILNTKFIDWGRSVPPTALSFPDNYAFSFSFIQVQSHFFARFNQVSTFYCI